METIYRYESTDDGFGIHRSRSIFDIPHRVFNRIEKRHCNEDKFPGAALDPVIYNALKDKDCRPYLFAYPDKKITKKAVTPKEFETLKQFNFKLYEITVKKCIKSEYQVVFLPDNIVSKTEIEYSLL